MKTLEEIQQEYAIEKGYNGYSDFMWCIRHGFSDKHQAITLLENFNTEISKRFAKAKLEGVVESFYEKYRKLTVSALEPEISKYTVIKLNGMARGYKYAAKELQQSIMDKPTKPDPLPQRPPDTKGQWPVG